MTRIDLHVAGLKEVEMALRRVDPELKKQLRQELKRAAEPVAREARRRVARSIKNRSRSTGKAERSLRVVLSYGNVYIVGGKASVPYFGWLDFGGTLKRTGERRNTQHRPIVRHAGAAGRYVYPAIKVTRQEIVDGVERAVDDSLRKAGLR